MPRHVRRPAICCIRLLSLAWRPCLFALEGAAPKMPIVPPTMEITANVKKKSKSASQCSRPQGEQAKVWSMRSSSRPRPLAPTAKRQAQPRRCCKAGRQHRAWEFVNASSRQTPRPSRQRLRCGIGHVCRGFYYGWIRFSGPWTDQVWAAQTLPRSWPSGP